MLAKNVRAPLVPMPLPMYMAMFSCDSGSDSHDNSSCIL